MKKIIIALLLLGWSTSSLSAEVNGKNEFIRRPYHFNIGYSVNKYVLTTLEDESDDFVATDFAHGGQLAFDWQGKGRLGFQIPVSYYFHPAMNASELDFGGNLMIHINKRDKAFDPYFNVGLKWVSGHAQGMEREWDIWPIPFLTAGFGIRRFFTPNIGVFGEVAGSTMFALAWQFEGRVGVSIGF